MSTEHNTSIFRVKQSKATLLTLLGP